MKNEVMSKKNDLHRASIDPIRVKVPVHQRF